MSEADTPAGGGPRPPKLAPFTPTPVNRDEEIASVISQASQLAPGAVDEALGHALDNHINARADQWTAQVHSEFAQYAGGLKYKRDHADSEVIYQTRLQSPDTHRVIETETARNAAALRLRGEDEKAAWPEPGHADPTLLAGRSGRYVYLVALLIAAAADIVAFYQVIELVLQNLSSTLVVVLVLGFTGTALTTVHFASTMLRDRIAGAKWIPLFLLIICAVVWVALGVLAFWMRLRGNLGGGSAPFNPSVTGPPTASSGSADSQGTAPGAAMFAGLYLATGAVALIGSYLTHNPLHNAFARAVRDHGKAAKRNAESAKRLGHAEAERAYFDNQIIAAERVRDEAIRSRLALAQELKQQARLELAKRLRDVSATDAFLLNDARPYTYRPFTS